MSNFLYALAESIALSYFLKKKFRIESRQKEGERELLHVSAEL